MLLAEFQIQQLKAENNFFIQVVLVEQGVQRQKLIMQLSNRHMTIKKIFCHQ